MKKLKSTMKKLCLYCTKESTKGCEDPLCKAKGEVVRAYCKAGLEVWQVMVGIRNGIIRLDTEAKALLFDRQTNPKAKIKVAR